MWYFISNQVTRSKILKNKLVTDEKVTSPLLKIVMNVIWPFEYFALSRCMNVYLIKDTYEDFSIVADESAYELVLYNLVQNAAKFNKTSLGEIVITVQIKKSNEPNQQNYKGEDRDFILET